MAEGNLRNGRGRERAITITGRDGLPVVPRPPEIQEVNGHGLASGLREARLGPVIGVVSNGGVSATETTPELVMGSDQQPKVATPNGYASVNPDSSYLTAIERVIETFGDYALVRFVPEGDDTPNYPVFGFSTDSGNEEGFFEMLYLRFEDGNLVESFETVHYSRFLLDAGVAAQRPDLQVESTDGQMEAAIRHLHKKNSKEMEIALKTFGDYTLVRFVPDFGCEPILGFSTVCDEEGFFEVFCLKSESGELVEDCQRVHYTCFIRNGGHFVPKILDEKTPDAAIGYLKSLLQPDHEVEPALSHAPDPDAPQAPSEHPDSGAEVAAWAREFASYGDPTDDNSGLSDDLDPGVPQVVGGSDSEPFDPDRSGMINFALAEFLGGSLPHLVDESSGNGNTLNKTVYGNGANESVSGDDRRLRLPPLPRPGASSKSPGVQSLAQSEPLEKEILEFSYEELPIVARFVMGAAVWCIVDIVDATGRIVKRDQRVRGIISAEGPADYQYSVVYLYEQGRYAATPNATELLAVNTSIDDVEVDRVGLNDEGTNLHPDELNDALISCWRLYQGQNPVVADEAQGSTGSLEEALGVVDDDEQEQPLDLAPDDEVGNDLDLQLIDDGELLGFDELDDIDLGEPDV